MITQLFTFGCGQTFANGYVKISAYSAERCREIMFETFGTKWSMQYDEEKEADLIKYDCTELCNIVEGENATKTVVSQNIFTKR